MLFALAAPALLFAGSGCAVLIAPFAPNAYRPLRETVMLPGSDGAPCAERAISAHGDSVTVRACAYDTANTSLLHLYVAGIDPKVADGKRWHFTFTAPDGKTLLDSDMEPSRYAKGPCADSGLCLFWSAENRPMPVHWSAGKWTVRFHCVTSPASAGEVSITFY